MKKSLIITATAILLFAGCTEEKKETKTETTVKQEVVQSVDKKVEETKAKEVKAEEKKVEEVKTQVTNIVVELNGETLFKTCTSCHGPKGEKEALGKSQVIAGWDKERVVKALNGYKDGSYGGVMKGIMKPHVESKTPEQIEALADFISKL